MQLISNTSYYHRENTTGYDGTLYNLGFYQQFFAFSPLDPLLLDAKGVHLNDPLYNPGTVPGAIGYRAQGSVNNRQQNFTQEFRLQSADANAPLVWTTGLFYASNRQQYLEQIIDPNVGTFLQAIYTGTGNSLGADATPNDYILDFFGFGYDPAFPNDSYFLQTHATDEQIAWFGEASYRFTDQWKLTVGARYAQMKFKFNSVTGGPQLYDDTTALSSSKTENSFTPKASLSFQANPDNLFYLGYAKGFRPGGGNNPVPFASCSQDFTNFGITNSPATYDSDTVDSYEVGSKNSFNNRIRLATSVYYIKWHNIQQTVVPPICQISWISNLGEATAKGLDFQADLVLFEGLTADVTAAYTDARYTKDSRLSPDLTPVADRVQWRCDRRPGRPARAAVHGLGRPGVSLQCLQPPVLRARRLSVRRCAEVERPLAGSDHRAVRPGELPAVVDQFPDAARRHGFWRLVGIAVHRQRDRQPPGRELRLDHRSGFRQRTELLGEPHPEKLHVPAADHRPDTDVPTLAT